MQNVQNFQNLNGELINLTDINGKRIGVMEKMSVHRTGALHEAFSIFIFKSSGEMLLQKRAKIKYHSGGLWSNACCGHPRPEETVAESVHRRLREEMGFDCDLTEKFSFIYKTRLDRGLTEYEFDHIFIGIYDGEPAVNPSEAEDWKWSSPLNIEEDLGQIPMIYTFWFRALFARVVVAVNERSIDK